MKITFCEIHQVDFSRYAEAGLGCPACAGQRMMDRQRAREEAQRAEQERNEYDDAVGRNEE